MTGPLTKASLIVCLCLVSGCAQGPNGTWQPTLPWNRQAPSTAAANPWTQANEGVTEAAPRPFFPRLSRANSRRSSFLNDLMQRADEQGKLADTQRKQIEELRRLQLEQQKVDRDYIIAQRTKERANLEKAYAEKEQQIRDRYDQLRGRASDLDSNNRDLHARLANAEQRRELLQNQVDLLKQRLSDTTQQLETSRQLTQDSDRRLQALQASASRRRGPASITANSSLNRAITAATVPGMDIRQDQDLVRISTPTDKLFVAGTASLHQGSQAYMDQVANVLREYYPRQMVGIEAHTDHVSTQLGNTRWRNQHQLTAAQSMAIFEQLTARNLSPHQLFVIGHGGNHPLVSSGTSDGQMINRRVEIVVYPETFER